ncbi:MAG: conjugal transfer protein TraD, partial [Rickettsiaceae bacterium]|nr:conjugal transfer protein TraD [Rickettsiaceae bacterium]
LLVKAGLDHMHPKDAYILYGMLLDCKRAMQVKPEVKQRWGNLGKELLT